MRGKWTRFWLVDPLDGTKEFVKRNDEFSVNIALVDHGRPVLGVVLAPVLDVLYWACAGEKAFNRFQSWLPEDTLLAARSARSESRPARLS